MKKYSILMFNFHNYEILREPYELDDSCEYIYVTDNKELKSNKWKIIHTSEFKDKSPLYSSFYVRYHPFKYVNTNTCFIIDGSIQIKKSLSSIYEMFNKSNTHCMLSSNAFGHTFLEEISWWIKNRGTKEKNLEKTKHLIKKLNLENYRGSFEIGFRAIKNIEINNDLNDYVWNYLNFLKTDNELPRIDQIIFGIVFNEHFKNMKVMNVTRQAIQSDFLQYCYHNTNKPVILKLDYDKVYFRNTKIKPILL